MRIIPIAVAVLALTGAAASAQVPATHSPGMPGASTAPAAIKHAPAPNPLAQSDVSKIEGKSVYGGDNKSIGHVSQVLMDPKSKKIDQLVVAEGGVLGIGSHHVAIPVDKFSWDADKDAFKLPMTVAEVKKMPEWKEGATATAATSSPAPANKTAAGSSTEPAGKTAVGSSTPPASQKPSNGAGGKQ